MSVVGDKVLINGVEKMTAEEWVTIRDTSVYNAAAAQSMLGKYVGGGADSYVNLAAKGGHRYFSLGEDWESIEAKYGLDDSQMFDLFNKPILDEAIGRGQIVRFTHDPDEWLGALKQELDYLTKNGYRYDPEAMTAYPKKGH